MKPGTGVYRAQFCLRGNSEMSFHFSFVYIRIGIGFEQKFSSLTDYDQTLNHSSISQCNWHYSSTLHSWEFVDAPSWSHVQNSLDMDSYFHQPWMLYGTSFCIWRAMTEWTRFCKLSSRDKIFF